MWTQRQAKILTIIGKIYKFMYPIPVVWNSKTLCLAVLPRENFIPWYIGLSFVFSLWLTCVYTLVTELFHHRKSFQLLNFCVLTTGFCAFTACLTISQATSSHAEKNICGANSLFRLERQLLKS